MVSLRTKMFWRAGPVTAIGLLHDAVTGTASEICSATQPESARHHNESPVWAREADPPKGITPGESGRNVADPMPWSHAIDVAIGARNCNAVSAASPGTRTPDEASRKATCL